MARAWIGQVDMQRRQQAVWSFVERAVRSYAAATGEVLGGGLVVSPVTLAFTFELDTLAVELAESLGRAAAQLPIEEACYQLSTCYTAMLPQETRSSWGAYYTPPALTDRLLAMAEDAGVDWQTALVLDPACGGGAFLLPVALRMRKALVDLPAERFLAHISTNLRGFEIDPFAAWLTQVWLEIAFADEVRIARQPFPSMVTVCDSLSQRPAHQKFDLVVGNPPYGRIRLPAHQREHYSRSLYGHANLYGLFTDLALRWAKPEGVVAYVTPTSFLAGEYFKALRGLLAMEASPLAIDFVTERRGVFEDVLQETVLSTYRLGAHTSAVQVHYLAVNGKAEVTKAGQFELPEDPRDPWLAPRTPDDVPLVAAMAGIPTRLRDWGYKVSTGPLVWNRFKPQFRMRPGRDTLPVVWAESITADGRFVWRAEKRSHQPYFRPTASDEWLKVDTPCVLLQRTTAKEQARRLIAAEMPEAFIHSHGGVIVENHLNMVKPINGCPKVQPAAVAAVLNSKIVDRAFRCMSGSVAVSAFELEALPLPNLAQMRQIETLLGQKAPAGEIEALLETFYTKDPA